MTVYKKEKNPHGIAPKTGVLLLNLGTPDAPTPSALRRYLGEFLWDPRIVEMSRPLWWLILHGIILRTRPSKSAHAYQTVWTDEGSPLLLTSREQQRLLNERLQSRFGEDVVVELGMRYGNPSIPSAIEKLKAANVQRMIVLPLYPQYSATTTASTYDAIFDELKSYRWIPEMRLINGYHDDENYINALCNSIKQHWDQHGQPDKLIFSFHGTPKRYFDNGDPYYCFCQKTARLVAEKLMLPEEKWQLTFQSRFGKEEWLQPYTDETLSKLPSQGVKNLQVICPGFSVDCLETIEEIAEENREIFMEAGGESFSYIEALNANDDHIDMMAELVGRHTLGWPVNPGGGA